jgi:ABC-type multidrug transport system ATPase subunit
MIEALVSVDSVYKSYGEIEAVRGVSFDLRPGEVVGLIGPNGAGKTTTIRMISTLLRPSSGSMSVCGLNVMEEPKEVRRVIGMYPEVAGLYERLTVRQNLRFYASFYDIEDREKRILDYLEMFELADRKDMPVGKLSKGMKEKIIFIRTVIHDPRVILLDEPLTGLDPDSRITLKNLLKRFSDQGKAIFLSSHTLSEVENICDRVILIDAGKVLVDDQVVALKERFRTEKLPTLEEVYLALRHEGTGRMVDQ